MPRFTHTPTPEFSLLDLLSSETIYIRRLGGLGDILLCAIITSGLSKHTNSPICFVAHEAYHDFLMHFPGITSCASEYTGSKVSPFFRDLQQVGDVGVKAMVHSRWDIFEKAIGVPFSPDDIDLTPFPAKMELPRFIGIVPSASSRSRTWPGMFFLARRLLKHGPVAIISSFPLSLPKPFINLTGLPLEDFVGLLKYCKLLITPDTGLLHVAMLLRVPALAVFGPIDAKLRIWRTETVTSIQRHDLECSPCHEFLAHSCPPGKELQCLTDITVDEVYETACSLL